MKSNLLLLKYPIYRNMTEVVIPANSLIQIIAATKSASIILVKSVNLLKGCSIHRVKYAAVSDALYDRLDLARYMLDLFDERREANERISNT